MKHLKSPLRLLPLFGLLLTPAIGSADWWESSAYEPLFALQHSKEEQNRNYDGKAYPRVTLLNLNTHTNLWYLLRLLDAKGKETLFNIQPMRDTLRLGLEDKSPALLVSEQGQQLHKCDIDQEIVQAFAKRKQRRLAYLPICKELLYITIKQNGEQTTVERGAEMLRLFGGDYAESIINGAKESFFKDKYIEATETTNLEPGEASGAAQDVFAIEAAPPRARVGGQYKNTAIPIGKLGLKLKNQEGRLLAGQWYPIASEPGFFASLIEPAMVDPEILKTHRDRVNPLDGTENQALAYLMAFDLDQYSLGWGHGTDHPNVGWSERAVLIQKDNPNGPDGFKGISPLIPLGHVPPSLWHRVVGTFSAGFQLRHSAFKSGDMGKTHKAHHYGFMEKGVLMASPSPDLVTMVRYQDDRVDLKTWQDKDNTEVGLLKDMRQNGAPLIERDAKGKGIPGALVKYWGPGNWSGSADKVLRTPRGAGCLIENGSKRFWVYAYFSGITPSGMARVFQAYDCKAAIQLDMNSPGQAYASLSRPLADGKFEIEHLMTDMFTGDTGGTPRYVIKPDYKDFFYILRR
jgi:hypothetical protein